MPVERRLKTGSQPYGDGSGYRFDIEIISDDAGEYLWLGNDMDLRVELDEWEALRADIDKAIAAFRAV